MRFDRGNIFPLQLQEGYQELPILINEKKVEVTRYAFIVLLMGRADLWINDNAYKIAVNATIQAIRNKNSTAMIVLTATLPAPGDECHIIRTAKYRNSYLSRLAGDNPLLEFSRPGKHLLQVGGPDPQFYDDFDNLNDKGLDMVRRALEAKFVCGKLRAKQQNKEEVPRRLS